MPTKALTSGVSFTTCACIYRVIMNISQYKLYANHAFKYIVDVFPFFNYYYANLGWQ